MRQSSGILPRHLVNLAFGAHSSLSSWLLRYLPWGSCESMIPGGFTGLVPLGWGFASGTLITGDLSRRPSRLRQGIRAYAIRVVAAKVSRSKSIRKSWQQDAGWLPRSLLLVVCHSTRSRAFAGFLPTHATCFLQIEWVSSRSTTASTCPLENGIRRTGPNSHTYWQSSFLFCQRLRPHVVHYIRKATTVLPSRTCSESFLSR